MSALASYMVLDCWAGVDSGAKHKASSKTGAMGQRALLFSSLMWGQQQTAPCSTATSHREGAVTVIIQSFSVYEIWTLCTIQ
ncbi:hypothetical protein AAC387_Pa03g3932 [Persea americana]